jgi:hypothetical protein
MQLTAHLPRMRARSHSRPSHVVGSDRTRHTRNRRSAGGPEDRALYTCECGYCWRAEVTTSVGCPHCGTRQAW